MPSPFRSPRVRCGRWTSSPLGGTRETHLTREDRSVAGPYGELSSQAASRGGGRMRHDAVAVGPSGGPAGPPGSPGSPMRDAPGASVRSASSAGRFPARRGGLDLLRALVVVGLVLFHTAVIFGAGDFPVKAAAENRVATGFLAFGATWGMPLLFVIAGMGIWYSLRSRSVAAFARERLRRLGVPLVVGVL